MTGTTPTEELRVVLLRSWMNPFKTKSDFARTNAPLVACAASLGLITTQIDSQTFGHLWLITAKGLEALHGKA